MRSPNLWGFRRAPEGAGVTTPESRVAASLYPATLFASAFLLFALEPMIAKRLLPRWGGAPAVWLTCMVFFQTMLLAGYLYAHLARVYLSLRAQAVLHGALLVAAVASLYVGFPLDWTPPDGLPPAAAVLVTLLLTVGLPFLALSANAPLLQHWFARGNRTKDPYLLYAASNLGSLVALLAYPTILEPALGSRAQSAAWGVGLALLAALVVACAVRYRETGPEAETEPLKLAGPGPTKADAIRWTVLAFVPSSLMLGVTSYYTVDIASIPLLWVLPLALYLLSFVLIFSRPTSDLAKKARACTPYAILHLLALSSTSLELSIGLSLAAHLGVFFIVALALHSQLALQRPEPRHLTYYFLWISFGGMLGGLFNSVVAPLVFNVTAEYPLALAAACLALYATTSPTAPPTEPEEKRFRLALGIAVTLLALVVGFRDKSGDGHVIARDRNFFGVISVRDAAQGIRKLVNGTTLHGAQKLAEDTRHLPLTYYHYRGPVSDVFWALGRALKGRDIAVIGLGAGTLAAWAMPDQRLTFYEIDEKVERMARKYFTYLADAKAPTRVVIGDARLRLEQEPDGKYTALFADAFSSDAVPVHLLTREAIALYLRKTTEDGIVAIHVTSRHLRLDPIVGRIAAELGAAAVILEDKENLAEIRYGSTWIAIARKPEGLRGLLKKDSLWKPVPIPDGTPLWTDDFTSFFSVLDFASGKYDE